eukprot:3534048-Prymnesium_polylepis.1
MALVRLGVGLPVAKLGRLLLLIRAPLALFALPRTLGAAFRLLCGHSLIVSFAEHEVRVKQLVERVLLGQQQLQELIDLVTHPILGASTESAEQLAPGSLCGALQLFQLGERRTSPARRHSLA